MSIVLPCWASKSKSQRIHIRAASVSAAILNDIVSELFVLQVLAADVNIGYEEMVNTRVQKVNGKQVKNLLELVKLIGGCTKEFLRLDLEYNQVRQHGGFTVRFPAVQLTSNACK